MAIDDAAITTRTKMALATDERAGLLDIRVDTIEGVVYLRGEVECEEDRAAAARVAALVEGVREVRNELAVLRLRRPAAEPVQLPESRPFARKESEER